MSSTSQLPLEPADVTPPALQPAAARGGDVPAEAAEIESRPVHRTAPASDESTAPEQGDAEALTSALPAAEPLTSALAAAEPAGIDAAPLDPPAPAAASAEPNPAAAPPDMTPAACGQLLRQRFPALFAGAPKPLKLRIQVDIQERAPGVFSRKVLSAFLHRHTGSHAYLAALERSGRRFDLDGQPCAELSAEHRQAASDELARRRAGADERRALEAQQRRNRAGLLRDFETTTLTRANFCALKAVAEDELDGLLALARTEAAERPAREPMPPHRPAPAARPGTGMARQRPGGPGRPAPVHGPRRMPTPSD